MGSSSGSGGNSVDRIEKSKAMAQLTEREKAISNSMIGKVPGMANVLGKANLSKQKSELQKEGSYAVGVPGTGFEAQGQRYSERPGQTPAEFQSKISASKPAEGSGLGYVGDVAGVSSVQQIGPFKVRTFTGKTGYGPTGEKESPEVQKDGPSAPVAPTATPVATVASTTESSKAARRLLAQSQKSAKARIFYS